VRPVLARVAAAASHAAARLRCCCCALFATRFHGSLRSSLCWKTEFPFAEKFDAVLPGWSRLFLQNSMDHRGTPAAPGRVVTLVRPGLDLDMAAQGAALRADATAGVNGVVYRVADADAAAVLANLDFREKGGYTRAIARVREVPAQTTTTTTTTATAATATATEEATEEAAGGGGVAAAAAATAAAGRAPREVKALVYTGTTDNPNYAGRAAESASLASIGAIIAGAAGPSGPNREYLFALCEYLRSVGAEDAHCFELERLVRLQLEE